MPVFVPNVQKDISYIKVNVHNNVQIIITSKMVHASMKFHLNLVLCQITS